MFLIGLSTCASIGAVAVTITYQLHYYKDESNILTSMIHLIDMH